MRIALDIDGVLADCSHRIHYVRGETKDWKKFLDPENVERDGIIEEGSELLRLLSQDVFTEIFMVTGRSESLREITRTWLYNNCFSYFCSDNLLLMRPEGDYRNSSVLKAHLVEGLNINLAIDDNIDNIEAYQRLGIATLHFVPKQRNLSAEWSG